ncbi:MAG TPA: PQQ-binding-like beta-propeller repeat protein [Steroidobacteraceae bacterium]|nr:PQQ-binding-like beta-propeller repeat protein [Steroidobacteraceae bacterium]
MIQHISAWTRLLIAASLSAFMLTVAGCGGDGGSTVTAPSGLTYPSPQTLPMGVRITTLTPQVSGSVTRYSVSPALPAGLVLDSASGEISGTPSGPSAAAGYTVTAQNAGGSTAFVLSLTVVTVAATPAAVARIVAAGTPVQVAVLAAPVNFAFSGTTFARASDGTGVFTSAVSVVPTNHDLALTLTVSRSLAPGHYAGNVTVSLCSDAGCAHPEAVPSVSIPFDVEALSSNSVWLGDHPTALTAWSGVPDWTMFQGNAAHTGYVPVDLDPNRFSTRWQAPAFPAADSSYIHMPATANGEVFVAGGNVLYARQESDGSLLWQHDFSDLAFPSVNPPAVANGIVYVAAGQQTSTYLFAFKAADGTLVFQAPMSSQWEHYLAPTIGAAGIYTDAGEYGGLYAFTASGQQLFFASMGQTSEWTPAADADHIYAYTNGAPGTGGAGGGLSVLDPASGSVQAFIEDPTFVNYAYAIEGAPVLGAPGSVIVANYANSSGNVLLDFDLALNSISWKIAGAYPSTPAYHAQVIYAANNNPLRLEARAEADGGLLWSWTPSAGDTRFVSEVLLTHNLLFVSTDVAVYGIDTGSHAEVWSYPLSGRLSLSQNGVLYIEGAGPLTAINVK